MPHQTRRVVVGHDANGRAVIERDDILPTKLADRPGVSWSKIWATNQWPIDNLASGDGAELDEVEEFEGHTYFRIVQYDPGCAPRPHRTETIDYAVVLSGEIDLEADDCVVHLKAGDLMVERGTMHNWVNRGTEPCVIVFILIGAHPVKIGDNLLRRIY